jgi:transposase
MRPSSTRRYRRRRWTLEQKLSLVESISQPGVSVAAVSDRHGVSRSLLFDWRRQAREGTMPGMVGRHAPAALVPVCVVADKPPRRAPRPHRATARPDHPGVARDQALCPGKHAVLLLDQAGWHASGDVAVPNNIALLPLSAKCPVRKWDRHV